MAESMNMKKSKWFLLQPTNDFLDLMFECEDEGWTWEVFLKNVEMHFREVENGNKDKVFKSASVIQKVKDMNTKLKENDAPIVAIPLPKTSRVNWAQRAAERRAKMQEQL